MKALLEAGADTNAKDKVCPRPSPKPLSTRALTREGGALTSRAGPWQSGRIPIQRADRESVRRWLRDAEQPA